MVRVNDKWDIPWQPELTVDDVLVACKFTHRPVVVSVNGSMIPPEEYATWPVADQDQVKVIHIIGGG
jgi:thiamine biosynthesis protein ThiS